MGSKTKLMNFVLGGINETHRRDMPILDLFSGSASLAGTLSNQVAVISNDIQAYSALLADTYTIAFKAAGTPSAKQLIERALINAKKNEAKLPRIQSYYDELTLDEFNEREEKQKALINVEFDNDYHLFTKYYSGTWWSAEQATLIDAFKQAADDYKNHPIYPAIMSSLMFAMAYTSIGTGHYAQYRDAKTASSMKDIELYRKKLLVPIFERKYSEILNWLPFCKRDFAHASSTLDYAQALYNNPRSLVYADPPYCFVHYSRFYHALETLALYDYPALQKINGLLVKGRYREERHQSPFCIKSKVPSAFKELFESIKSTDSKLVLSYSNTGMIEIEELYELAANSMPGLKIRILTTDYKHMTLGRQKDRDRSVEECLLLAQ